MGSDHHKLLITNDILQLFEPIAVLGSFSNPETQFKFPAAPHGS